MESCYLAHTGFELSILLPQPPKMLELQACATTLGFMSFFLLLYIIIQYKYIMIIPYMHIRNFDQIQPLNSFFTPPPNF
jgi:hypothetical protein